jgi:hypothetical protein
MMAKPAVILVGADKGGVGKTTIARTLLDYFASRKIVTRAFDTEHPKGTLKRFHPGLTEVVNVTSVPDQMKIFDTVESSGTQVTLIDIKAGLMTATLVALRDIGFIDMTKRGDLAFAVFHILGPSIASLDEIAETSKFLDAGYFLVKNFINNTSFFDWDEGTYNSYFNKIPHAVDIVVPKLSERACEKVEISAVPFATFIVDKTANGQAAGHSFALKGYVRHRLKAYSPNATALGLQKFRMHKMLSGVIRQGRGAVCSARQFLRTRSQPLPTLRACGGRDGE